MPETKLDAEMQAFANDVLESIRQAKRGEHAAVHTPEQIAASVGTKEDDKPEGT